MGPLKNPNIPILNPKALARETAIKNAVGSNKFTIAWIDEKGQVNLMSTPMGLAEQALMTTVIQKQMFDYLGHGK